MARSITCDRCRRFIGTPGQDDGKAMIVNLNNREQGINTVVELCELCFESVVNLLKPMPEAKDPQGNAGVKRG